MTIVTTRRAVPLCLAAAALAASGCGGGRPAPSATSPTPSLSRDVRVLLFTRTTGFRHDSIPNATRALTAALAARGATAVATEDPAGFTGAGLAPYAAVVFLLTTGDVLNDAQQAAFEQYIAGGGALVGVHSATDTEYAWTFYHRLLGATFKGHPAIQPAAVDPSGSHPAIAGLPSPWKRTDEWYNFTENPRAGVRVLATVDERTYSGGTMGADHPISWCAEFGGGRSFYTGMGHTAESYDEPLFMAHLLGGVLWAAGVEGGSCAPGS